MRSVLIAAAVLFLGACGKTEIPFDEGELPDMAQHSDMLNTDMTVIRCTVNVECLPEWICVTAPGCIGTVGVCRPATSARCGIENGLCCINTSVPDGGRDLYCGAGLICNQAICIPCPGF